MDMKTTTFKHAIYIGITALFAMLLLGACGGGGGGGGSPEPEPVILTSITLNPEDISIAFDGTQNYIATGHYSDASSQDISGEVTWSSSETATATINATGQATAVAPGTSVITASLNSVFATTNLTVAEPLLLTISLTPGDTTIRYGNRSEISATGTYEDGSMQDISQTVNWSSSDPIKISIDNTGIVTAEDVGRATLFAELDGITAQIELRVAGVLSLAKTGQTQCYDAFGTELRTCLGTR